MSDEQVHLANDAGVNGGRLLGCKDQRQAGVAPALDILYQDGFRCCLAVGRTNEVCLIYERPYTPRQ